jgi:hypothetical protein
MVPSGRDVHALGRRPLRQARHGHDVAGVRHDEAGAGGRRHLAHRDVEVLGRAAQRRVVGEGVLRLRHADGHVAHADVFEPLHVLLAVGV